MRHGPVSPRLLLDRWQARTRNSSAVRTPEPRYYHDIAMQVQIHLLRGDLFGYGTRSLVFPALFHRLPDALRVLLAVVFVQVGGFDVGRGAGIRVIEETAPAVSVLRL
jgi:hypothetical protein